MLRAGESNYLAFNDVSLCNRLGIDGGAIESWGTGELPRYRCHLGCILLKMAAISSRTGTNNTWEYNALHDMEGPMEVFFADDWSPGLRIQKNVVYETNNVNVFMIKSLNNSVSDNIVADSTWALPCKILRNAFSICRACKRPSR